MSKRIAVALPTVIASALLVAGTAAPAQAAVRWAPQAAPGTNVVSKDAGVSAKASSRAWTRSWKTVGTPRPQLGRKWG